MNVLAGMWQRRPLLLLIVVGVFTLTACSDDKATKINREGNAAYDAGDFQTALDRYRDLAISPDGQRIFLVTDNFGTAVDAEGKFTSALEHPGTLIEFTFVADSRARQ